MTDTILLPRPSPPITRLRHRVVEAEVEPAAVVAVSATLLSYRPNEEDPQQTLTLLFSPVTKHWTHP